MNADLTALGLPARAARREGADARPAEVSRVYEAHAAFVWATLQRMGVRSPDLEDVLQEVFVVVHRRFDSFDGSSKMTTWLFGICVRVASTYRRRGFRRKETCVAELPETPPDAADAPRTPERLLEERQSRALLDALLDELDVEKRAVFVMFELEEMTSDAIAELLGIPVGTVHSRLFAARKAFQKALARWHAREARRAR